MCEGRAAKKFPEKPELFCERQFPLHCAPNRIRRSSLPAIRCPCVNIESPRTVEPPARQNSRATGLLVKGMTCGNCARHVTEAIQGVAGVRSATVSLESKNAKVRWNPGATANIPAVIEAVKNAGYEAKEIPANTCGASCSCHEARHNNWHWNLVLGIAATAALMTGEWVFNLATLPWFQWLSFALAGAVQIFAGAQFYRGAWNQLKIGGSNMDTLVALGSTTAFGYSAWALLAGAGGHLYFMEAAAIITLISLGHWIEARVSDKASGALKSLLNLAPQTARRVQGPESKVQNLAGQPFNLKTASFSQSEIGNRKSEIEQEVPVAELKIGDRVVLKPGDRVPVDGVVVEGESALDEVMLTGESVPADKKSGSELFAGTVNVNGRLVMRVTATGEATALAHIIAAVQRAQTSRADIQRLGDRISNVFVPVIICIALAAGIFWAIHSGAEKAFVIASGILIVACPCAMGLATPAAIMAAANAAARRGILIRDGVALEKAGKITAVIFDKTGTLTEGKPKIIANKTFPINLPAELKSFKVEELAATIAIHSKHPLSKTIAASVKAANPVTDFRELPGRGISGLFSLNSEKPHFLQLGSLAWLTEEKVECEEAESFANDWMDKGATVIGIATDLRLIGVFALRDTIRPNAVAVINQLENSFWQRGYKVYIVSGDTNKTVHAIANELNIGSREAGGEREETRVFAEVRPEQKAEFVKKLQATGERVAFVGDGINDAPALTQADLGIAVSRASDVAREAADIILLKSEIEAVPEALGLARATLRTIKQNLFWAFFYNALGVPLAALGFISPIFCAAAMGCSDLIVIGNALRLLRWRK
jgi:P-type Cu+ transporter